MLAVPKIDYVVSPIVTKEYFDRFINGKQFNVDRCFCFNKKSEAFCVRFSMYSYFHYMPSNHAYILHISTRYVLSLMLFSSLSILPAHLQM